MMTRNQVIEALFIGKNFNDCIAKMDPAHLRDDLKMEVIAIVCEWPDEKIMALHQEGKLEFFVVRVILNQIQSSTSPFYNKYRRPVYGYGDITSKENWFNEEGSSSPLLRSNLQKIAEHTELITDPQELEDRITRENREDLAIGEIENLHWYSATLVKLYLKKGNYRALQEATNIPYISCYKTIQKSFKELKTKALCQVVR